MSDCQAKRNAAMQANPNDVPSIPECKPDGTYSDVQCNRMTQECWCADNKGNEILNTRTNGTLRCKNDGNCKMIKTSLVPCCFSFVPHNFHNFST